MTTAHDARASQAARREWEEVGALDPLWAVLSTPETRAGRWDRDEFFRTGEREVDELMRSVEAHGAGRPERRVRALEFACGVGRVTRALAGHFEEVVGLDGSQNMVERARELNADVPGCEFVVNDRDDLRLFEDESFDLIYTRIALQHLPTRGLIKSHVAELVRTLRHDGLLVFQLITHIPLHHRLRPRHRAYRALRRFGASPRFLHERLRLMPFFSTHVPEPEVTALLSSMGARALRIERDHIAGRGSDSATFFVARDGAG